MKRSILYLITTISLFAALFTGNVSAKEGNDRLPDAFNIELEKKKLKELSVSEAELTKKGIAVDGKERVLIQPGKPLVLTFDDGSKITYSVRERDTDINSYNTQRSGERSSTAASGNIDWEYDKTYEWSFGYATIIGHVDNTDLSISQYGSHITLSGDPSDITQTHSTLFASVEYYQSRAKTIYHNSYYTGFRSQHTGKISYDVFGFSHETSYDFIWEVYDSQTMYLVSSY